MFRFPKTLDVVTLFHRAGSSASVRVATLLKQANAAAAVTATEDQASDHSAQTQPRREAFELHITEDDPTEDQVKTMLDYIPQAQVTRIFQGAGSPAEGLKAFRRDPGSFTRPVVVDWNNGKAVAGANESEILKMLSEIKNS